MDEIAGTVRAALGLGLDNNELGVGQVALRAAVVYVVTLGMVRLAKKRFISRATAFDVILGIVLESVVSRAITGNAPFGPPPPSCSECTGRSRGSPCAGTASAG